MVVVVMKEEDVVEWMVAVVFPPFATVSLIVNFLTEFLLSITPKEGLKKGVHYRLVLA
jgi:hypothetical protein